MIDRFFYAALLASSAAAMTSVLGLPLFAGTTAVPPTLASAATAQVVELPRVVITASRDRAVARSTARGHDGTLSSLPPSPSPSQP